jgi:hypothetical protein
LRLITSLKPGRLLNRSTASPWTITSHFQCVGETR